MGSYKIKPEIINLQLPLDIGQRQQKNLLEITF